MTDWLKIKAEYIRGGISYREIARKYNISFSQLKRKALTEKWYALKTQAAEKATTALVDDAAAELARRYDRIVVAADKLLDAICEGIDAGIFTQSTKAIREIAASLKDLRDIQGIKTDADMREQEARIKKLEHDCRDEDAAAREIRVIMAADINDYAE